MKGREESITHRRSVLSANSLWSVHFDLYLMWNTSREAPEMSDLRDSYPLIEAVFLRKKKKRCSTCNANPPSLGARIHSQPTSWLQTWHSMRPSTYTLPFLSSRTSCLFEDADDPSEPTSKSLIASLYTWRRARCSTQEEASTLPRPRRYRVLCTISCQWSFAPSRASDVGQHLQLGVIGQPGHDHKTGSIT